MANNRNVLIIDNEPRWTKTLESVINDIDIDKTNPIKIDKAKSLKEATNHLNSKKRYNLIVSDIHLDHSEEEISGWQLFHELNKKHSDVPVIAITGKQNRISHQRMRDLFVKYGIVDFVLKGSFDVPYFQNIVKINMAFDDYSAVDIDNFLNDIINEIIDLEKRLDLLAQEDQKEIKNAVTAYHKKGKIPDILKHKIEVCIPIIPIFMKWKLEIDLNSAQDSMLSNLITPKKCNDLIATWNKLNKIPFLEQHILDKKKEHNHRLAGVGL